MANISKNIKRLRKQNNLTQDELAEKLFVTRQTVSGWENGRTQPALDILCDLAEALNCNPLDIINSKKPKMTREKFVALIFENEEKFFEVTDNILHSPYLCQIAIKNAILEAFSKMEELSADSFAESFTGMLEAECEKLKGVNICDDEQ
ncbi:MAG: helix-turn-helix transcriptional regulator [Clostridia bacterium]|nr:helix-turn-helix transcriptional regulator [Clostridia bacterium]